MDAKVSTMEKINSNKRVTVNDVANELDNLKTANDLQHAQMRERMDDLREQVKDNRKFFEEKFAKIDNRMWMIVGLTVTTLITIVIERIV